MALAGYWGDVGGRLTVTTGTGDCFKAAGGKFGYLPAGDRVKGGNLPARLWLQRLPGAKAVATAAVWCDGEGGQRPEQWRRRWATGAEVARNQGKFGSSWRGRGVGCG